ncbi:MAG: type II secretion system protein [bacterium]|nr:type II secretion system protein [bacterium]
MNRGERGFIFLFTLSLITIMALLSLTLLQHVLLYYKAINRQERQHQLFYQMESIAGQLTYSQNRTINSMCMVDTHSANKALEHLTHHKGCSLDLGTVSFQYIIEDLGIHPCLIVRTNDKKHSTHHVRITILAIPKEEESNAALQVRVIQTTNLLSTCSEPQHIVSEGISSWRYLADYNVHYIEIGKTNIN